MKNGYEQILGWASLLTESTVEAALDEMEQPQIFDRHGKLHDQYGDDIDADGTEIEDNTDSRFEVKLVKTNPELTAEILHWLLFATMGKRERMDCLNAVKKSLNKYGKDIGLTDDDLGMMRRYCDAVMTGNEERIRYKSNTYTDNGTDDTKMHGPTDLNEGYGVDDTGVHGGYYEFYEKFTDDDKIFFADCVAGLNGCYGLLDLRSCQQAAEDVLEKNADGPSQAKAQKVAEYLRRFKKSMDTGIKNIRIKDHERDPSITDHPDNIAGNKTGIGSRYEKNRDIRLGIKPRVAGPKTKLPAESTEK